MVYVIDDTRSFTILTVAAPPAEGSAQILAIRAPASANAGSTVQVEADVINNGGTDTIFVQLASNPTVTVSPAARLEATVNAGATATYKFSFSMPSTNVGITVSAGHVE